MNSRRGHKTPRRKKTSKHNDASNYIPRFEFGSNIDHEGTQTATIKELLEELIFENIKDSSNQLLDISSLRTVLRFFRAITGKTLKSSKEKHPVTDIKTIKALYNYNRDSGAHLIGLIEPPGNESQTIIDILTSPPTPDNEKFRSILNRIISDLAKEIAPDELVEIDKICDPDQLREKHLQETKKDIDNILLEHIYVDEPLIKEADDYLINKTRKFHESIRPMKREPRIHTATYTYLKLLDYVHWLHFEVSTYLTISNDRGLVIKEINFDQICRNISEYKNMKICKDTNFMSIDEVPYFILKYSSEIAKLVSSATGYKYNKRDAIIDKIRATIVLDFYLYATRIPNYVNEKMIGVVHVVSAFCSLLHQRKMKSKPGKKSRRYSSKLTSPQKKLDIFISQEAKHVPVTVLHIYEQRTKWYLTAMLERKDKLDSHHVVHIAQSELNKDIYMSLDHVQIKKLISEYRNSMEQAAHEFVALHNRQDFILEWKENYRDSEDC